MHLFNGWLITRKLIRGKIHHSVAHPNYIECAYVLFTIDFLQEIPLMYLWFLARLSSLFRPLYWYNYITILHNCYTNEKSSVSHFVVDRFAYCICLVIRQTIQLLLLILLFFIFLQLSCIASALIYKLLQLFVTNIYIYIYKMKNYITYLLLFMFDIICAYMQGITEIDVQSKKTNGTKRWNDKRTVTWYLNVHRNLLHIYTLLQLFHPKIIFPFSWYWSLIPILIITIISVKESHCTDDNTYTRQCYCR